MASVNTVDFEIPGADGDNDGSTDCEIDYDQDLDDDRLATVRPELQRRLRLARP